MNGIEEALEAKSTPELQRILKRLKQDLILGLQHSYLQTQMPENVTSLQLL